MKLKSSLVLGLYCSFFSTSLYADVFEIRVMPESIHVAPFKKSEKIQTLIVYNETNIRIYSEVVIEKKSKTEDNKDKSEYHVLKRYTIPARESYSFTYDNNEKLNYKWRGNSPAIQSIMLKPTKRHYKISKEKH